MKHDPVVRWRAAIAFALLSTATNTSALAQEHIALPPVNLGGTSFMDGVGGPGLLLREGPGVFDAQRFTDANGATVPGNNSLFAFSSITLAAYMPPFKVLGGNWGVEVLVSVVYAHVTTPMGSGSTMGFGDITFSPFVWQAPTLLLFGRQFFQRLDLDIVAPTGQYDRSALVSAGGNMWSVNPYYAFTWFATDRIETSWRLHCLWNSANSAPAPGYEATSIQPGQAVHFNGAVSFAVVPALRIGVAGYFLRQITDSQANGRAVAGSQEQVAALGPGFLVGIGALQLGMNAYGEFAVENRPQGTRVTAVAMEVW